MLSVAVALALAGFAAGVAGTWSPCGFSMVDTLGAHGGGRRRTFAALAAFAPGALLGGAATFGVAGLVGSAISVPAAIALAVAVLVAAALLDARARPVRPQVRRQVPESWRRVLPLPLAAGLYGVLLGLGFTTFVMSWAAPALVAACVALGEPVLGLVCGVAFGLGRLLPIVVLAPVADREAGARALEAMAGGDGAALRRVRAAAAVGSAALATALALGGAPAGAATTTVVQRGLDPSVAPDGTLAWDVPSLRRGYVRGPQGGVTRVGRRPAVSGRWLASVADGRIALAPRASGTPASLAAPGADAVAVSDRWVAWRARRFGRDVLTAVRIASDGSVGPERVVARATPPASLSRPGLDGDRLVWATLGRSGSAVRGVALPDGRTRTLRRERAAVLTSPSPRGGRLLYTRTTSTAQELRLGPLRPRLATSDRRLLRRGPILRRDAGREPGRPRLGSGPEARRPRRPARDLLFTTALGATRAYVTLVRRSSGRSRVVALTR